MKIALQVIAILITVAGHIGMNAEQYPFVLPLIHCDYQLASKAKDKLWSRAVLEKGDTGFEQITNLIRSKLTPKKAAEQAVFEKIERLDSELVVPYSAPAKTVAKIKIYTLGNPAIDWDLITLSNEIEKIKSKNFFTIMRLTFWIGIILNFISLLLTCRDRERNKK